MNHVIYLSNKHKLKLQIARFLYEIHEAGSGKNMA